MKAETPQKRVVSLDPYEVQDETLAALKREICEQSDYELDDIDLLDTLVLDSKGEDGLESHAVFFSKGGE